MLGLGAGLILGSLAGQAIGLAGKRTFHSEQEPQSQILQCELLGKIVVDGRVVGGVYLDPNLDEGEKALIEQALVNRYDLKNK